MRTFLSFFQKNEIETSSSGQILTASAQSKSGLNRIGRMGWTGAVVSALDLGERSLVRASSGSPFVVALSP